MIIRIMYVLQAEDGKFYWKEENTFYPHSLKEGFENAYLFKTRKEANRRKKYPCYSTCDIKEVEVKLVIQ